MSENKIRLNSIEFNNLLIFLCSLSDEEKNKFINNDIIFELNSTQIGIGEVINCKLLKFSQGWKFYKEINITDYIKF